MTDEVAGLHQRHQNATDNNEHPWLTDSLHELLQEAQQRAQDESEGLYRIRKAILLSPTLEVCEALLRGEKVPREKLNQRTLARLRRR